METILPEQPIASLLVIGNYEIVVVQAALQSYIEVVKQNIEYAKTNKFDLTLSQLIQIKDTANEICERLEREVNKF